MIFENEEAARETLESCRQSLADIDYEIIELLALRAEQALIVAVAKHRLDLPARVPEQHAKVLDDRLAYAARLGVSSALARSVFVQLLEESVALQNELLQTEPTVTISVTPVRIRQGSAVTETGEGSFRAIVPPLAREARFIAE